MLTKSNKHPEGVVSNEFQTNYHLIVSNKSEKFIFYTNVWAKMNKNETNQKIYKIKLEPDENFIKLDLISDKFIGIDQIKSFNLRADDPWKSKEVEDQIDLVDLEDLFSSNLEDESTHQVTPKTALNYKEYQQPNFPLPLKVEMTPTQQTSHRIPLTKMLKTPAQEGQTENHFQEDQNLTSIPMPRIMNTPQNNSDFEDLDKLTYLNHPNLANITNHETYTEMKNESDLNFSQMNQSNANRQIKCTHKCKNKAKCPHECCKQGTVQLQLKTNVKALTNGLVGKDAKKFKQTCISIDQIKQQADERLKRQTQKSSFGSDNNRSKSANAISNEKRENEPEMKNNLQSVFERYRMNKNNPFNALKNPTSSLLKKEGGSSNFVQSSCKVEPVIPRFFPESQENTDNQHQEMPANTKNDDNKENTFPNPPFIMRNGRKIATLTKNRYNSTQNPINSIKKSNISKQISNIMSNPMQSKENMESQRVVISKRKSRKKNEIQVNFQNFQQIIMNPTYTAESSHIPPPQTSKPLPNTSKKPQRDQHNAKNGIAPSLANSINSLNSFSSSLFTQSTNQSNNKTQALNNIYPAQKHLYHQNYNQTQNICNTNTKNNNINIHINNNNDLLMNMKERTQNPNLSQNKHLLLKHNNNTQNNAVMNQNRFNIGVTNANTQKQAILNKKRVIKKISTGKGLPQREIAHNNTDGSQIRVYDFVPRNLNYPTQHAQNTQLTQQKNCDSVLTLQKEQKDSQNCFNSSVNTGENSVLNHWFNDKSLSSRHNLLAIPQQVLQTQEQDNLDDLESLFSSQNFSITQNNASVQRNALNENNEKSENKRMVSYYGNKLSTQGKDVRNKGLNCAQGVSNSLKSVNNGFQNKEAYYNQNKSKSNK